jgi:hypothetical protein
MALALRVNVFPPTDDCAIPMTLATTMFIKIMLERKEACLDLA